MSEGVEQPLPYDRATVWVMLEGSAELTSRGGNVTLRAGDVALVPANLAAAAVRTRSDCLWLEMTPPSSLAGH